MTYSILILYTFVSFNCQCRMFQDTPGCFINSVVPCSLLICYVRNFSITNSYGSWFINLVVEAEDRTIHPGKPQICVFFESSDNVENKFNGNFKCFSSSNMSRFIFRKPVIFLFNLSYQALTDGKSSISSIFLILLW